MNTDQLVLAAAYQAWNAQERTRRHRERNKRFTYGRQWDDLMRNSRGEIVTEGQNAEQCSRKPLTNNLIRQLVKCVVGRFRQIRAESRPHSPSLAATYRRNTLAELDARTLEEFLISGCAIQRVVCETRPQGPGVWVDIVNPSRFFVNRIADPRGHDTEIIGMLHDMSLPEVLMRFSHGDRRRAKQLRELYLRENSMSVSPSLFYNPEPGRCRVIEVWTLECAESRRRGTWGLDTLWRCRYFTPSGELIDTTVSPYPHGQHPFVVKMYPLTDGEIHPFVEDIIDQQKYINRLISTIDHIVGTSAKGVLLFPREQKPDDMSWADVGTQWAACDGILPYDPRPGEPIPQQINSAATNSTAFQLLNLEMKLFEDVSGVSDALMGRVSAGVNGQSMYESQVRNATIALADILDTFTDFLEARDRKIEKSELK